MSKKCGGRETGLEVGQTVSLQTSPNGAMIKARRKRYTAAELNAQCDPNAAMPDDLVEWENMAAVGLERQIQGATIA